MESSTQVKPQVIVCGLGRTGYRIFLLLKQQDIKVVGISERPLPHLAQAIQSQHIVVGDIRHEKTLLTAGIQHAQTLLIASNDDALNLAVMTQARILNPRIRIINRLFNSRLGDRLDHTLPNHLSMSVAALVAPIFAFAALGNRAIGYLRLFEKTWPIEEHLISSRHPWHGQSLQQLWDNPDRMLLVYESVDSPINLIQGVMQGRTLQCGDRLVISNCPHNPHHPSSPRQQLRQLGRRLTHVRHQSRAILWVLLALLTTIGVATLTYISTSTNTSIIDAVYFSVGMITGAGGQEAVAEQASSLIKLFTAVMMIVGAGVIGVCYALLNDFILGTHLQQLWTTVHAPNSSHHIVCGLGGVGIKLATQLRRMGQQQLVIEYDPNSRFLAAAHHHHIPVLIGDASVADTLKSARIHTAASLLAITSNDMVNLEIGITAKSLAPQLPVLVRIHDPKFAHQIKQVFDFDMVMSPTELAAPVFAAAAIGGRIVGNCLSGDGLWFAIATPITPIHPLCKQLVHEAAIVEGFTPLYIETSDGERIQGPDVLTTHLEPEMVLHLMIMAKHWDHLWGSRSDRAGQCHHPIALA